MSTRMYSDLLRVMFVIAALFDEPRGIVMTVASAAEPPVYNPVGLEEYERTKAVPETLFLPFNFGKKDEPKCLITRSPYQYLHYLGNGMFSDRLCSVEGYGLVHNEVGATLTLPLWNGAKCIRGREDWMIAVPPKQGVVSKDLAWLVHGWESFDIQKNDVIAAYLDNYLIADISERGMQLCRITDACPLALRPIEDCRPIPCSEKYLSPLFRDFRRHEHMSGAVKVKEIRVSDGNPEALLDVYPPDYDWIKKNVRIIPLTVRVGDQIAAPGFQSYTVRRIVPPQEVNLGEKGLGRIRQGWIEIENEPTRRED